MYSIIQRYPAEQCLAEGSDGIRVLWVQDHVSAAAWQAAYEAGAHAVVRRHPASYVFADVFLAQYETDGLDLVLPEVFWTATDAEQPLVTEMMPANAPAAPSPFMHAHVHSEFSALDGLSMTTEMVKLAKSMGQQAIAITDHGTCAGHPSLQLACDEVGLKPVFGMEAYFVDDRFARENRYEYYHLCLWAMSYQGLLNLWAMSTEAFREGLYDRKPRLDWDTLERLNGDVLCSTACLRGPLAHPYLNGEEDRARANLSRLKGIFEDRLYIEVHSNGLDDQVRVNAWSVKVAQAQHIPLIAVCDSHYPEHDDADAHRVWLAVQTEKEVSDDTDLFAGDAHYHLMSEQEVRDSLAYLDPAVVDEAVRNTGRLADRCDARIEPRTHTPVYTRVGDHPDPKAADVAKLREVCMRRWDERTSYSGIARQVYLDRFETEFGMISRKDFAGYFLMIWDIVAYAKNNGILVGPGRGSGAGSLVAYLLGITEIDPVEYDILFERFMTEGRVELPDFDLDFPSSKKQQLFQYCADRWGAKHCCLVGTHMRLKNKSVFKSVAKAIKSSLPENHFPDIEKITALVDEAEADTAGLGLSWDLLMDRLEEEFEPYREKYPEVFRYADRLHHRLRTYGIHAAGIVIDPEHSLVDNLPLRMGEDGMVCQFDLSVLDLLGYCKVDLLSLRNLDTLQLCIDLIYQHTGRWIEPYHWHEELKDPEIFSEIGKGRTLGMFQINTNSGKDLCMRYRPNSLNELAHVITLVRPGPKDSGLQKQYLQRRDSGEKPVYADERMAEVLDNTHGCLLFQEQLMQLCMRLAKYTDVEADTVRKILGKKKVEAAKKEAPHFIECAVENGTDRQVATDLWHQMEAFARYSFGFAHAISYALLAIWCAWFKVNYPLYFLSASLSTVEDKNIPSFVEETRATGYYIMPPDINASGAGFTVDPPNMAVRYGLAAIRGVGAVGVSAITAGQPFEDFEDFDKRRNPKEIGAGTVKVLNSIGALESIAGHRKALERRLDVAKLVETSKGCIHRTEYTGEHGLPCSFDWDSLPPAIGKSGKLLKKQPGPPKTCSRACKQFVPLEPPPPEDVEPYTDDQIRRIEFKTLGIYLSSTPFDRLDPEDREALATAEDIELGEPGSYTISGIIQQVRPRTGENADKNGNDYAFINVLTERGRIDMVVFSSQYAKYAHTLIPGHLCLMVVQKTKTGQNLTFLEDLDDDELETST